MGIFRTLSRGVRFLVLLAVLLVVGWIFREDIEAWVANLGGDDIAMNEPSSEAAARLDARLRALASGAGGSEARFTEIELQSYVEYRVAPQLPDGVQAPAIELRDSTVAFSAKVDFTRLAVAGEAATTLGRMFGDSALVVAEVVPEVGAAGEGRLRIASLHAGVIPVPTLLLGMAGRQLGLRMEGRTVLFGIPAAIADVRVEADGIVLVANR